MTHIKGVLKDLTKEVHQATAKEVHQDMIKVVLRTGRIGRVRTRSGDFDAEKTIVCLFASKLPVVVMVVTAVTEPDVVLAHELLAA